MMTNTNRADQHDDEHEQNDDRPRVHQELQGGQELRVQREKHPGKRDDVN
jgi:hypothetical protein